jgi:hypothetical protein
MGVALRARAIDRGSRSRATPCDRDSQDDSSYPGDDQIIHRLAHRHRSINFLRFRLLCSITLILGSARRTVNVNAPRTHDNEPPVPDTTGMGTLAQGGEVV